MRLSKFKYLSFLLLGLLILPAVCSAAITVPAVKLNAWTSPSQGYAGSTTVQLTGSGFPSTLPTPANVTVTVALTCGGASLATTAASSTQHILGSSDRIGFQIPSTLAAGTYQVSASDSTGSQAFISANCSSMKVLPPKVVLSSCVPGASIGILNQKPNVTAYVPNGAWAVSNTGLKVVPLEGGGLPAPVATPGVTNSCSSNSATGTTVCTANNTDVYLLSGSTLNTTLTSGADTFAGFSGGSCFNCGVAIDSVNNLAYIQIGLSTATSGTGLQTLNLGTNTFATPFPLAYHVSEDIQVDPGRGFVFSPNESNVYDLVSTGLTPTEYGMPVSTVGEFDSAGEDCTTGIAVSTQEFTGNLFISDVTQASFVAGTPGSWSAPSQSTNFPEFVPMSAGTSGIAVAPGSHLAIVSGEFGGNLIGVVTLPSTSGTGTPAFGDYVACNLPPTPDGTGFSAGYDPHTVTAYVSPNTSGVYGVVADWAIGTPNWLAVVDMQGLLSVPRLAGTHSCDPSVNLVGTGVVRYVGPF